MSVYYNEIDPYAAEWLRNLIAAELIPAGDVDERSIADVQPDDLRGYAQCHFFAGIAGWPYALRLAGWPDDRPVWTGSCPCQPFSHAGARRGVEDERHLFPVWGRLIGKCRPPVVFGEQVASAAGRLWLSTVRAEMEAMGYAVAGADLCAASVGAPHIRQRLWFVGLADAECGTAKRHGQPMDGAPAGMQSASRQQRVRPNFGDGSDAGGLAVNGPQGRLSGRPDAGREAVDRPAGRGSADCGPGEAHGGWDVADWLHCWDGKWRPVEPRTFPLAHGVPGRVGQLRAYGNAIVPALAATFIQAVMECTG